MLRQRTAEIIDISGFLADQLKPERPLILKPRAIWRTRAEPLDFKQKDGPLAWSLVRSGDLVRIPLIPYRVTGKDPVQTLLVAMDVMQRYIEAVPNAIRTHIILGSPIEEISDEQGEALRFWVGFSAQLH